MTATPMLGVQGLTIRVGERTLLRDLSLDLRTGELWCIVGANGAGKSLFLHTLVGLRPIERGRVQLRGRELAGCALGDAARVRGFLPQTNVHAFSMPVVDVVMTGRFPFARGFEWESEQDRAHALQALADMDVGHLAHRDVLSLSGGEGQRVNLAALLAQDVPLLLLDEPITHLDLRHQVRVLAKLRELSGEGRCVVLSIHDLNLANAFATHVLLLSGGGATIAGRAADVMTARNLSHALDCRIDRVEIPEGAMFVVREPTPEHPATSVRPSRALVSARDAGDP